MKITAEDRETLLENSFIDRIIITCKQHVLLSVGAVRYYNLTQNR
jgi:hypothetical protein